MADLAIEISKAAVQLVAEKVKSAIEEEEQQWQIVERDLVFITGEFEMMQSFLDTADGERIRNHVVRTWVRQVRDLSYDVEDCIDFVLHLDTEQRPWWLRLLPSCPYPWSRPRAALPVDEAVADITLLKARAEDISQRNMRYNLINDSGSKPGTQVVGHTTAAARRNLTPTPSTRPFNVFTLDTPNKTAMSDLAKVINQGDDDLRVISVYGAEGDVGTVSVIRQLLFEDKEVLSNFECRALLKLRHPFNPHEFIRNVVAQFLTNSTHCQDENVIVGVQVMQKLEEINIVDTFVDQVNTKRYLIVLEGVSSMEQWDAIRTYLPNRKNKSRIIVSTHQVGIAKLCTGKSYQVFMLKQPSSADHASHIFYSCHPAKMVRRKQEQAADSASFFGRDEEIDGLLELIKNNSHISVWGPPGIGKTTLMKAVFERSNHLCQAWANVSDPFNGEALSKEITIPLRECRHLSKSKKRKGLPIFMFIRKLLFELQQSSLVVIDDLKSEQEWDFINDNIKCSLPLGSCIVVITDNEDIATYCAQGSNSAVYRVKGLQSDTTFRLFEEKVSSFMEDEGNPSAEVVWRLTSLCSGLPQFITTLAGYVARKPHIRDRMEVMRLLHDNFMNEMQNNPSLGCLKGAFAWLHSNFDASPRLLKKCTFYLSVFPRGTIIRRKRLVRRWSAEGFSGGAHGQTILEEAEMLIDKLVDLGIMQVAPFSERGGGAIHKKSSLSSSSSCQVNTSFLEYIISRQMEERTFLPLEVSILEGASCNLFTQPMGRHLAIRSTWERDGFDFNILDLSRIRSLTVSGVWQPFFISEKMRVLRVLDLEGTSKINVQHDNFKRIGSLLPRLKFLSLRGCKEVCSLPDSLGELRQLQTLDIRGTSIAKLPPTILNLHKLENICAGTMHFGYKVGAFDKQEASRWRRVREHLSSLLPRFGRRLEARQHGGSASVVVPIGFEKPEALRTLSVVNAKNDSGREFALRDVKKLTKLSKLGVYGLARENSSEFWSLISDHKHMESLSVWGGKFPRYDGFPPNLTKLTLEMPSYVLKEEGHVILGKLEKLHTLRLRLKSALNLLEAPFGQLLKLLHVACTGDISVKFPEDAMKGLEQLTLETEATLKMLDGMEKLGKLKRLRTLCLCFNKYLAIADTDTATKTHEVEELQFGNKEQKDADGIQDSPFGHLKSLKVVSKGCLHVNFAQGTVKDLQQLILQTAESLRLDGLNHLGKLNKLHTLRLCFANTYEGRELQFGLTEDVDEGRELQFGLTDDVDDDDDYSNILRIGIGRSRTTSQPDYHFGSLKVLEIACTSISHIKFAAGPLKNLMKLTLRMATLLTAEDMEEIGKLEKLCALCLDFDKCQDQEGELQFVGEDQQAVGASSSSSTSTPPKHFGKLKVLEIVSSRKLHVKFNAMKNLEQLNLDTGSSDIKFSGLDNQKNMPSLKQVSIKASSVHAKLLTRILEDQFECYETKPVVKLVEPCSS